MISLIQNTDTLDLSSKPVNPRASEFYTHGSSFHDLFTMVSDDVAADPTKSQVQAQMQAQVQAQVQAPSTQVAADTEPPPQPTFEQGAVVTAPDGSTTPLNPLEMASTDTAAQIAAKLGGTVTTDQFAGGFSTSADIREISFEGSNVKINAGIAASLFAQYGDAPGSQAWRIINNDLHRDPMTTGPVS
jgi:hypothetical protein